METDVQARLERELRHTIERLRQLGGAIAMEELSSAVWDHASPSDAPDEIAVTEDREISLATRSRLVQRANKLAAALERVRTGTYGGCEECGEPIAPARLKALPEVATCVRCQNRIEQQARRGERVGARSGVEEDDE